MTRPRFALSRRAAFRPRLVSRLALATALATAPLAARADVLGVYYERSVMTAADQRCGLFSPRLASALAAAQAQARGAALRAGASADAVANVEARARGKAGSVPCESQDIARAADRVRGAFEGYSRLQTMSFPGDTADWTASRNTSRLSPVWKLSQAARFGGAGLVFGLAGQDDARVLAAVAHFPDEAQPYAARLILRNAALAPAPYLNGLRGEKGPLPLELRTPPRWATKAIWAEDRAPADPALLPPGARTGIVFRFPAMSAPALSQLDPREAVAVEFLFVSHGHESVRTAFVEVGDFAAGRAFLTAGLR